MGSIGRRVLCGVRAMRAIYARAIHNRTRFTAIVAQPVAVVAIGGPVRGAFATLKGESAFLVAVFGVGWHYRRMAAVPDWDRDTNFRFHRTAMGALVPAAAAVLIVRRFLRSDAT